MDIPKYLNYRFYSYDSNMNAYSCDMLRLKFFLPEYISQRFLNNLSNLQFRSLAVPDGIYIESYTGRVSKIGSYRYLFNIKPYIDTPWSVTLGYSLVTAEHHSSIICMLEFNPNKCDVEFIDFFVDFICRYIDPVDGYFFQLVRYDIAVDIPVRRSDVVLQKVGKRAYHRIVSNSVTEYSGCRNTNGFVKVYDKGVESDLGYELTRVEITCDNFEILPLPTVCIFSNYNEDLTGLNQTDRVLLRLLRELDFDAQQEYLKEMGYCKAKKLRPYLFPVDTQFQFDVAAIDAVIEQIKDFMEMGFGGHQKVDMRTKLHDPEFIKEHEKDGVVDEIRKKYLKLIKLYSEPAEQPCEVAPEASEIAQLMIDDIDWGEYDGLDSKYCDDSGSGAQSDSGGPCVKSD